jgi:hypothetical protein
MQGKGEMTDRRDHESRSTDETGTGHAQGAAFDSITNAPRRHLLETYPRQRDNGDERRYHDKRAGFFKCLPQDDRGEVDRDAYAMLLPALQTGEPADFEEISLSPDAERRLANPQAAYAFESDEPGLVGHRVAAGTPLRQPRDGRGDRRGVLAGADARGAVRLLRRRPQHRRCHQ